MLKGGKPSGREVKERKARLTSVLKEGFEFKEGAEVKVQSVLAYVGFDDDSQKLVSRTLKDMFPGVNIRREDKQGVKQYPFKCHFNMHVGKMSLISFLANKYSIALLSNLWEVPYMTYALWYSKSEKIMFVS